MDIKKKKVLVKVILILLHLCFISVVIDIGGLIFSSLHTKLFDPYYLNIFHINGLNFTIYIPTWPVMILIGTLVLYLICLRFLFKFIRKFLKAQKIN